MNLPELPEGYFWRVTTNVWLDSKPYVELHKKVWFWSERVKSMWSERDFHTIKQEVEYLAQKIYDEWETEEGKWLELLDVIGDY